MLCFGTNSRSNENIMGTKNFSMIFRLSGYCQTIFENKNEFSTSKLPTGNSKSKPRRIVHQNMTFSSKFCTNVFLVYLWDTKYIHIFFILKRKSRSPQKHHRNRNISKNKIEFFYLKQILQSTNLHQKILNF